jgi:hypothetical protein
MDFVISLGLLECHAPPRRTQQKSTAPPAAHPLGKHANLGPPSSPSMNGCRPIATLIEHPAYVRSPAKCATCAIYARSPHGQASLEPRGSGHASLLRDTPASSVTKAPTPSRAFATRQPARAARASSHPPQSHRALLPIFATGISPPKSAFLLTHFPVAESDVAPIPHRTPAAYHRNHPPYKGASPMALFNLWLVLVHFLSKRSV